MADYTPLHNMKASEVLEEKYQAVLTYCDELTKKFANENIESKVDSAADDTGSKADSAAVDTGSASKDGKKRKNKKKKKMIDESQKIDVNLLFS